MNKRWNTSAFKNNQMWYETKMSNTMKKRIKTNLHFKTRTKLKIKNWIEKNK